VSLTSSGRNDQAVSEGNPTATERARVFGFREGSVVQERGYDDDVDHGLRDEVEDLIDDDLLDEDAQEIVDGVLLWYRDGDGDLVDALVDARSSLEPGGPVWLLTPKARREGYVDPGVITEAASLAGFHPTRPVSVGADWSGTQLASPKG
jgi:hypothetical protein